jgi:hypothetical protein
MEPNAEPEGLSLSLDDIISQQKKAERRPARREERGPGPDRRSGGGGGRGGGRGGGGGFRDGGFGRDGGGRGGEAPRGGYRSDQRCFLEQGTGTVVFSFRRREVVRVTPAGDVTIDAGGMRDRWVLASLNDALNPAGVRVTAAGGESGDGEWQVSDGRALVRYADGAILAGKGPMHLGRGRAVLDAFHAARDGGSGGGGFAFAPPPPPPPRHGGGGRGGGRGGGGGGAPDVFSRLGGRAEPDDRERRLSRQGRYNPY